MISFAKKFSLRDPLVWYFSWWVFFMPILLSSALLVLPHSENGAYLILMGSFPLLYIAMLVTRAWYMSGGRDGRRF